MTRASKNSAAAAIPKREWATRLWPFLGIFAALAATAILLRLEGRLWLCACDRFMIWSGNTCSSDNSQHLLDPYSFTHLLHGFLFFWLIAWLGRRLNSNWQLTLAVAIESLWEVFENTNFIIDRYRSQTAALGYTGDTVVNSFGDILCCLVGFMIARRLGLRRSLIAFAVLELVLILWIRDSLLLEIVMLIVPVDAIKAMQLCR
ncbi:MAG TPA: DUF2585 family protein [Pyrinomonadaceae bacterium]|nr:DUF2585 family protein [Pyrinomonadaceae bacterium]